MLRASLTSKILRKNQYILFLDPFGTNNDTIKHATIHIIHAIRPLYAQNGPRNGDFGISKSAKWRLWHARGAKMATLACRYGVISDISMPVWRHSRHFDASMASYPTFRCHYGDISTPVWRHSRHFDASMATYRHQYGAIADISMPVWPHIDASMASYPTFRRQYGDISTPVWRHSRHCDASMAP